MFQTFHTPNFGDEEFDIPNINHQQQQQQQQQHAQQGHNDQQQHYQPPMQVIEFCYFNLIVGSILMWCSIIEWDTSLAWDTNFSNNKLLIHIKEIMDN